MRSYDMHQPAVAEQNHLDRLYKQNSEFFSDMFVCAGITHGHARSCMYMAAEMQAQQDDRTLESRLTLYRMVIVLTEDERLRSQAMLSLQAAVKAIKALPAGHLPCYATLPDVPPTPDDAQDSADEEDVLTAREIEAAFTAHCIPRIKRGDAIAHYRMGLADISTASALQEIAAAPELIAASQKDACEYWISALQLTQDLAPDCSAKAVYKHMIAECNKQLTDTYAAITDQTLKEDIVQGLARAGIALWLPKDGASPIQTDPGMSPACLSPLAP